MKTYRYSVVLLAGLAFGCIPDKRIVWSSDGKRAAVSTDHGLYIIDHEGRVLSPRLEPLYSSREQRCLVKKIMLQLSAICARARMPPLQSPRPHRLAASTRQI